MIATPTVLKLIEINTDKEITIETEDEIDNDKLKLYIEFSSTINLVFSDINTSSKIASTNKNLVSNLFNEIFIPPPEIV
jgi:hypothetical protein